VSPRLVTSRLLPVPHGFPLREGGVSEGPFDSLNLGFSVGDDKDRVEENLRRLCLVAGIDPSALSTVSQVHGDRVLEATLAGDRRAGPPPPLGEADALWTPTPGVAVGVRTADCVPILLSDPGGARVAAVHSGWKGTDARIAARAVEALVERGARADQLLAAVGPAIGPCCYAVSDELAGRFSERFGPEVVAQKGAKQHLDLPRAVQKTLFDSGLRADHVDVLRRCTHCEPAQFFSHRRDKGRTGRHLSFIVCAGAIS
jgi:YfiH family protein